MRLNNTLKMIPLMVGITGMSPASEKTNIDLDLVNSQVNNIRVSNEVSNSLQQALHNQTDSFMNNIRFNSYYKKWEKETVFSSKVNDIIDNRNFKGIVSMGNSAIPLILQKIQEKPSVLVWSLNIILNSKISQNNLSVTDACRAWVQWGLKNNII